jgi:hypothetical protein
MKSLPRSTTELLDLLQGEGVVTPDQADAMRDALLDSWLSVGNLLRQRGLINARQLLELLQAQVAQPDLRVGDLAIARGYCSESDLAEALRAQRQDVPHVLDLVLADPQCNHEQLCRVLADYVRTLETRNAERSQPARELGRLR